MASIKEFAKDMGFKKLEGWLDNDGLQDALAKHKLEKYKQRRENDISESSAEPKRENIIDAPDCCMMCKRLIINAGISKVIFLNRDESTREIDVKSWIEEEP